MYNLSMIKEVLQNEQLRKLAKPLLGFGCPPEGVSLDEQLKKGSLTSEQLISILSKTGKDLALIHARSGEEFGWINPLRTVITRKFVGQYGSWYEFLLAFYDKQGEELAGIRAQEKETGKQHTSLSVENREQFDYLYGKRVNVRMIFERNKALFSEVKEPKLLHGNLYKGSIFVDKQGNYKGLGDFSHMLLGDPLDDIAYFSVMPEGNRLVKFLQQGWIDATGTMNTEEKMHLYRLWESYRKIYTRYAKLRYLDREPGPLAIAREEIKNITGKE